MSKYPKFIYTGKEGDGRIYEVYVIGACWNCFEVDGTDPERNVLGRTLKAFGEHNLRKNIALYEKEQDAEHERVVKHAEDPDTRMVAYRVVKVDGRPTMRAVTVAYSEWVKLIADGWLATQKQAFDQYMANKAEEL